MASRSLKVPGLVAEDLNRLRSGISSLGLLVTLPKARLLTSWMDKTGHSLAFIGPGSASPDPQV